MHGFWKHAPRLVTPTQATKTLCTPDRPASPLPLAQVAEEGGWGHKLFHDTIASYKTLSASERPGTDEQKIQTWVRLSSTAAGVNLAPYYKSWGWPVTNITEAALAAMPPYIPFSFSPSPSPSPSPPPSPEPPAETPPVTLNDYRALAAGVGTLATSGTYASPQLLFGSALAVAAAADGAPLVSVARYGQGVVVTFGHEGLLGADLANSAVGRLIANAALWAAGSRDEPVRVAASESSWASGVVARLVALVRACVCVCVCAGGRPVVGGLRGGLVPLRRARRCTGCNS